VPSASPRLFLGASREAATIYQRLKRYDDEITLIRRFAGSHDISKRDWSTPAARKIWAGTFHDRLDAAKAALAAGDGNAGIDASQ
jgi:hypothetical protein